MNPPYAEDLEFSIAHTYLHILFGASCWDYHLVLHLLALRYLRTPSATLYSGQLGLLHQPQALLAVRRSPSLSSGLFYASLLPEVGSYCGVVC